MRRQLGWLVVSAWLLSSCTGRAEAVRAAQPYLENFSDLRVRALSLLELRADIERKKLLVGAIEDDGKSLPENLKPVYERMRAEREVITEAQLRHGEQAFWRMLDFTFSENPNVLQGEIVFLEKDGTTSAFRHPREREVPAGVKWYGLREHRTFAGLTKCVTDSGSTPCVVIQLRPRDYSGSAGLTVAYRREPIEASTEPSPDR